MAQLSTSNELAAAFEAAHQEFLDYVGGCPDEEWEAICPREGWPVGVVGRHVAAGHLIANRALRTMLTGRPVPGSPEVHNAANEAIAREHPEPTRDEVLELAGRNARRTVDLFRGLSEAQLRIEVPMGLAGGRLLTVQGYAELFPVHLRNHLDSMREGAALAREAGAGARRGQARA